MPLTWRKVYDGKGNASNYAFRSICGAYSVCRVFINGRQFFEAWRGQELLRIEQGEESMAMREVCEADANAPAESVT